MKPVRQMHKPLARLGFVAESWMYNPSGKEGRFFVVTYTRTVEPAYDVWLPDPNAIDAVEVASTDLIDFLFRAIKREIVEHGLRSR